ncbi:FGGY family carbohydrate kinase [Streptomyces cadmiisoli]|uniref:FGGY family carbohydrate kinase n=1 Tax=Streptomyces cadmiisoli TaxID=2184053 RepID=UPI001FE44BE0|nr:FGGY family carbohydrate kinase [Streptomyces cadmiisoli]
MDDCGRPTGPAALWSDDRAAELLSDWQRDGTLDRTYRRNGSLTCAGMPNAVLARLAAKNPERPARSATALTAGGWIFLNPTGRRATDESDASVPFSGVGYPGGVPDRGRPSAGSRPDGRAVVHRRAQHHGATQYHCSQAQRRRRPRELLLFDIVAEPPPCLC